MQKLVDLAGDVADYPAVHALSEQRAVPADEVIGVGGTLIARVVRKNVVVTTERRAGPDMGTGVPVLFGVGEVGVEDAMVDRGTEIARSEEVNAVEVGDVHTATVGGGDFVSKLMHIQHKEENVHAIPMLEEGDALTSVGDGQLVAVVRSEQRCDGLLQGDRGGNVAHHAENEGFLQVGEGLPVQSIAWRLVEHLLVNALQHFGREEVAERAGGDCHRALNRSRNTMRVFGQTDRAYVIAGGLARVD